MVNFFLVSLFFVHQLNKENYGYYINQIGVGSFMRICQIMDIVCYRLYIYHHQVQYLIYISSIVEAIDSILQEMFLRIETLRNKLSSLFNIYILSTSYKLKCNPIKVYHDFYSESIFQPDF